MQRAIAWGHWFANEHLRLFGPLGLLTREVRDAEMAWQVLVEYVTTYRDFNYLDQTTVNTLCQDKLKTKARIQKALKLLVHNGQLFPAKLGKLWRFKCIPASSTMHSAQHGRWLITLSNLLDAGTSANLLATDSPGFLHGSLDDQPRQTGLHPTRNEGVQGHDHGSECDETGSAKADRPGVLRHSTAF